jgi:hypothetical protein
MTIAADDGVTFDTTKLKIQPIREDLEYGGSRLNSTATLSGARISIVIDVGFGDAIEPGTEDIDLPVLPDMPSPSLSRTAAKPSLSLAALALEAPAQVYRPADQPLVRGRPSATRSAFSDAAAAPRRNSPSRGASNSLQRCRDMPSDLVTTKEVRVVRTKCCNLVVEDFESERRWPPASDVKFPLDRRAIDHGNAAPSKRGVVAGPARTSWRLRTSRFGRTSSYCPCARIGICFAICLASRRRPT